MSSVWQACYLRHYVGGLSEPALHAGLLEGAHAGRGLGHEFLRHCQRARILVHVIDGSSPDPVGDYAAIQTELQLFAEDLASKPQACVILLQLHVSAASKLCVSERPWHCFCMLHPCIQWTVWQPIFGLAARLCLMAVDATLMEMTVFVCRLWPTTRWMCQTRQITGKTSSTAWKQLASHQSTCVP